MFRITVRLASIVGALLLATTAVALAASGKEANKPSPSSISLVLMTASAATTTATSGPSYGDTVTFAVSTDATSQPLVHLKCSQNGSLVLRGVAGLVQRRPRRPDVPARAVAGLAGWGRRLRGVPRELGLVLEERADHDARVDQLPR